MALAESLSAAGIRYRKTRLKSGHAVDMEIEGVDGVPILLEIKSGASASDVHTGIGQLHLYRQLFTRMHQHRPVLLLGGPVPAPVAAAVERLGIALHHYIREEDGQTNRIRFSSSFLALCGVEPTAVGPR